MFEKHYPVMFTVLQLLDYDKYLCQQITYYQQCRDTGCLVSDRRYKEYMSMRSQILDVLEEINS